MVRTRRQADKADGDVTPTEDEIPVELLDRESRKRRRDLEKSLQSPAPNSASKRQRKSREKADAEEDAPTETHTHHEITIPVATLREPSVDPDISAEIPSSAAEDIDNEEQSEEEVPVESSKPKKKTPANAQRPLSKKAALRAMKPSSAQISSAISNILGKTPVASTKPKHKRFGSEEAAEELAPELEEEQVEAEDSSEEESDDDAPEEVVTGVAEEEVRKAEREAAKAAEIQEAGIKKKRKERDEQFKLQVKASTKRRKRFVEEEGSSQSDDGNDDTTKASSKPKLDRHNLPAFLPEEYLSDTGDAPSQPVTKRARTLPKNNHLKFLEEKKPKDIKIGSTIIRVVEKGTKGAVMPPKADSTARNTKESWLQGRKLQNGGTRKKAGGGFFIKKK